MRESAAAARVVATCCAALLTLPQGCARKEQRATNVADSDITNQAKCTVARSQNKPLIVEWPAADRAALESRAKSGIVPVRYTGCEMEVLTACIAQGGYAYNGLTVKREGVRIRNLNELYAQLPVGAAKLEGKLADAEQLNIEMIVAGRLESDRVEIRHSELEGRCAEATHVITGITTGAFLFYAGEELSAKAEVKIGHVGGGAGKLRKQEILSQDGDEDSCYAESLEEGPPPGCGALLRVDVVPIGGEGSYGQPVAMGPQVDPVELKKRQRRYTTAKQLKSAGSGLMYMSLIPAAIFVSGQVQAKSAQEDYDNTPTKRDEAEQKGKRANVLTLVGAIGTGVFLLTGASLLIASAVMKKRNVAVAPAVSPTQAGVAVEVRF